MPRPASSLKNPATKKLEEFLADLENNPDTARTCRTIKSLFGTPYSTTFAEPLLHKGRTFTTNRGKTNAFMKEYAAVNRLRFSKEERNRIRQLKSTLKSPTAGQNCCAALGMEELDEASFRCALKAPRGQMISSQRSSNPKGQEQDWSC